MDDRAALEYARELEAADAELHEAIERVDGLQRRIESLRGRAVRLLALRDRLPGAREAAAATEGEARRELERRREERGRAEAALDAAGDEERAEARRALVRSQDAEAAAADGLARAEAASAELAREAAETEAEEPLLGAEAADAARALAELPRLSPVSVGPPAPGPGGVEQWAARARAALFVVRGGLDTERERVVRQANELAAGVLGEPVAATSVALVRRRLEAHAASAG